jgi:hypothetical protein
VNAAQLILKKRATLRSKNNWITEAAGSHNNLAVAGKKICRAQPKTEADILDIQQGHRIIRVTLTAKAAAQALEIGHYVST